MIAVCKFIYIFGDKYLNAGSSKKRYKYRVIFV